MEEHAELPEVVPLEELSTHAIEEAAHEIEVEQGVEESRTWPTTTA